MNTGAWKGIGAFGGALGIFGLIVAAGLLFFGGRSARGQAKAAGTTQAAGTAEAAGNEAAPGKAGPAGEVGVGASVQAQPARSAGKTETVILAGGCFWGMEDILRKIPGVVDTEVGYSGGKTANPDYEQVHRGNTGHAEAVRVEFDPSVISFSELLGYFFRMHDPTTLNRQGNDIGTQYRSAIFYTSEEQRRVAERVREEEAHSGRWKKPITTEITAAGPFYSAEEYHQDYLLKHPGGYTCHYLRP